MSTVNDTLHIPRRGSRRSAGPGRRSAEAGAPTISWRRTRRVQAPVTPLSPEVDDDLAAWARAASARNGFGDAGIVGTDDDTQR